MTRSLGLVAAGIAALVVVGCGGGGRADGGLDARVDGPASDGGVDAMLPDGGGPVDMGTRVTICPGDALPSTASGRCDVTAGSSALLITADVLTPGEVLRGGQVLVDATGTITCAACDCAAAAGATGATTVVCPDGVVSPGLINAHDHITYTQDLPYTMTTERYEQRHDWRRGQRGHTSIPSMGSASNDQMTWGELRFVLGGATSTNGSGSVNGFVRNVDKTANEGLGVAAVHYDTFPLGDTNGLQLATGCGYPAIRTAASIAGDNAYTPHVSEGIDDAARNEFTCLTMAPNDLILPQTAVIHGAALLPGDFAHMAMHGTGLIWSPRSNITLYGDTARVTVAARLGVTIALGTDWMPTGSMNELRELACADSFNAQYLDHFFTDEQLWRMATRDAAVVLGIDAKVGTIATGQLADLTIFDARVHHDYRAVIAAAPADVMLVLRAGATLYGDDALVSALPGAGAACDMLDVCGTAKRVCAMREVGKTLAALMATNAASYPLFYCALPDHEPSCVPSRPLADPQDATLYTGMPAAGDTDGDGIPDASDLCPRVFDPIRPVDHGMSADADMDGTPDACDPCPTMAGGTCGVMTADADMDGIPDATDNCPTDANPMQTDTDMDGHGDACDRCPMYANPGAAPCLGTVYEVKNGTYHVGDNVAISGVVVTGVGANGFFAQIPATAPGYTGPDFSGVFVYTATPPTAAVGDVVDLPSGTLTDFHGELQLSVTTVTVTSSGAPAPTPVDVPASDVITGGPRAAALESVLVHVAGPLTVMNVDPIPDMFDTVPTNEFVVTGMLRIDDFIYLTEPFAALQETLASVTGVLALKADDSKIEPRSAADVPFTGSPVLVAFGPASTFQYVGASGPTIPAALTAQMSRAAATDVAVTLVAGDASLTVPATVTVPAGMTSVVVPVTGVTASATATMITATLVAPRIASVRVIDASVPPHLVSLTPAAPSTPAGGTVTLTAALDVPAPAGGSMVTLAIGAGCTGPASVTVPAMQVAASFDVTCDGTMPSVIVTAHLGADTAMSTIAVVVGPPRLLINEIDYDQIGTDTAEFLEIVNIGTTTRSLVGVSVILFNGSAAMPAPSYATYDLSGVGALGPGEYLVVGSSAVMPASSARVLSLGAVSNVIQNGASDGVAIVDTTTNTIIDSFSYEGGITMATVPGVGVTSLVHGTASTVADSNTVAESLCRIPNAATTDMDMTDWRICATPTPGAPNTP